MGWAVPFGAQALLNLRYEAFDDDWEPFVNYSIHQETTRLYTNCPVPPKHAPLHLVA